MNIARYLLESRGVGNAMRRLPRIARRFGVTPRTMERRLNEFTDIAARYGCRPTLAVTAVLLERYPESFRRLAGSAELAVHGYVHTDYQQLDEAAQAEHMERALHAFQSLSLRPTGFRCPYLRWNVDTFQVASTFGLTYSSNYSLAWDTVAPYAIDPMDWQAYQKGLRLYGTRRAADYPSLPSLVHGGLLDMPASLPDDEAMVDRLALDPAAREGAWLGILDRTYSLGEQFTLILHHERVPMCGEALEAVLARARSYDPPVYMAPLADIADWWLRRRTQRLTVEPVGEGRYRVSVPRCEGLTVLVRHAETEPGAARWYGDYGRVPAGDFTVRSPAPPVISLDTGAPAALREFLQEEGFVVTEGGQGLRISGFDSFTEEDKRRVIDLIEASDHPLVRIWRWPDGARSALSITGDVDAMTLVDFFRRPLEV